MKINIIVGTVRGGAERLATFISTELTEHQVHITKDATLADLDNVDAVLFCTSNTAAGDFPPNIVPFYTALKTQYPRIAGLRYGLVCLGNSNYETFAQTGRDLDEALVDLGAKPMCESLIIDASEDKYPNQRAQMWLEEWLKAFN